MKIQGTVKRSDLEGGLWMFETNQGVRYQLEGGGSDLLRDGQRATIQGEVAKDAMGFGMSGEIFRVERYELE